jgi:acid phosphatase (class A)
MLACTAAQARYLDRMHFDFIRVLGPPPPPPSAAGKADIAAVLAAQAARSEADVKAAQEDDATSVFRYADVLGPGFKPEAIPFAATFFKDVGAEATQMVGPAREYFNRPRPIVEDPRVMPAVKAANASYPSGTSTFAYTAAILLAAMVPEKAAAIFARAGTYAHNRVVAGVHYPTDVEGGRIAASVIGNALLTDDAFKADYATARAEVRHAIGLE